MTRSGQTVLGFLIGALVLAAVSAGAGYWYARRGNGPMQVMSRSQTPNGAAAGSKPLYWYDPMQPNQHFDEPGKSPFMDMPLVPKYADESGDGGVRVSPNTVQNLGIRVGRVESVVLRSRLHAVGTVAFDERLLELVQARVDGYVTQLHVKAPFAHVARGQPLAEILAPQWLEAEQQYLALLDADAERVGALRQAARERLIVLGVAETSIQTLESTRKPNATTTLYAPTDGVITELAARQGAAFIAGASLFRINGLKTVWVNAQIPEAQVSAVTAESSVEAQATAWPGARFMGRVLALLPDVDPQTRTLTARVAIDNDGRRLFPGMYLTLDFASSPGAPQLVVPSEAVITTGTRNVVIVMRGRGGFDVVKVTTGREQDGRTPILSGLAEGESVVLSGQFLIDSEASLTAAVSRLQGVTPPEMPR
jgi:membrane fusion protein, copper/silver efflux system